MTYDIDNDNGDGNGDGNDTTDANTSTVEFPLVAFSFVPYKKVSGRR